jgi:hypothetical protein
MDFTVDVFPDSATASDDTDNETDIGTEADWLDDPPPPFMPDKNVYDPEPKPRARNVIRSENLFATLEG